MIAAALATIVAAALQSATGFGFALVLGPALFALYEPAQALTTLLVLGAALNLLMLFGERRRREIRWRELLVLLGTAIPGLVVGALILRLLEKPALQVAVGAAVLLAAAFQARARRDMQALRRRPVDALAGFAAGALTTTTSTNGPPLVLRLQRLQANPAELRDSITTAFLTLNVLGAITLALLADARHSLEPRVVVPLLVVTTLGHAAGRRAFERLGASRFRTIGLLLVVAAGLASIVAGLSA